VKDLWVSFAVGAALGLVALVAMVLSWLSIPVVVAIALGLLGAMAVLLFRLGPGIRDLMTGMARDRVEIAKATEELRRLMSRIREPSELEIVTYGGGQRLIPIFEERQKESRVRKEP
jgi:hypothetical protein